MLKIRLFMLASLLVFNLSSIHTAEYTQKEDYQHLKVDDKVAGNIVNTIQQNTKVINQSKNLLMKTVKVNGKLMTAFQEGTLELSNIKKQIKLLLQTNAHLTDEFLNELCSLEESIELHQKNIGQHTYEMVEHQTNDENLATNEIVMSLLKSQKKNNKLSNKNLVKIKDKIKHANKHLKKMKKEIDSDHTLLVEANHGEAKPKKNRCQKWWSSVISCSSCLTNCLEPIRNCDTLTTLVIRVIIVLIIITIVAVVIYYIPPIYKAGKKTYEDGEKFVNDTIVIFNTVSATAEDLIKQAVKAFEEMHGFVVATFDNIADFGNKTIVGLSGLGEDVVGFAEKTLSDISDLSSVVKDVEDELGTLSGKLQVIAANVKDIDELERTAEQIKNTLETLKNIICAPHFINC